MNKMSQQQTLTEHFKWRVEQIEMEINFKGNSNRTNFQDHLLIATQLAVVLTELRNQQ
jgi:hypothetical protein